MASERQGLQKLVGWWGKIVGAVFGYMLGGLPGAIIGVLLGHYFDMGMGRASLRSPFAAFGIGRTSRVQRSFFTATFSIMGFIAKADGQVTKDEITLAQQVMSQMRLSPAQKKEAISLFQQGKQPGFRYEEVLARFRADCFRRRNLVQMFLEVVTATALSDGRLNRVEKRLLLEIAGYLGYSATDFEVLVNRLLAQARFASGQGHGRGESAAQSRASHERQLEAAYKTLAVSRDASDVEVKRAYRRLMSQHHPDKLVSRGLPKEMTELANQKVQEIKQAYELIKSHRAL